MGVVHPESRSTVTGVLVSFPSNIVTIGRFPVRGLLVRRVILSGLRASVSAEAGVFLLRGFILESLCFSWEARRSYNVPYLCVKLSDFDLLLRGFLLIRNVDTLLWTCQHVSGNHPILSTSC